MALHRRAPYNPQPSSETSNLKSQRKAGFGLFRFRSPLLAESRLLSFPPGTEMVHFPGFARTRLWIQRAVSDVDIGRVSPFGDPRINGCFPLPEAYRR
jgi:hypothetical protein